MLQLCALVDGVKHWILVSTGISYTPTTNTLSVALPVVTRHRVNVPATYNATAKTWTLPDANVANLQIWRNGILMQPITDFMPVSLSPVSVFAFTAAQGCLATDIVLAAYDY